MPVVRTNHLLEVEDGRPGDGAIEVEECREVLELLANNEAECGQHRHAAVGNQSQEGHTACPPPAIGSDSR
eukprot:2774355-Pyramimonas_sp.AAC.1